MSAIHDLQSHQERYQRDGYVIVPGLFTPGEGRTVARTLHGVACPRSTTG